MAYELPSLLTVTAAAAVDSINPCAIGVLIFFVTVFLTTIGVKHKDRMLRLGLVYIGVIYTIYFLAGLALSVFFALIPNFIAQYVSMIIAVVVVFFGILEIKDFFWYGQGMSLSISGGNSKKIKQYLKHKLNFKLMVVLGAFVTAVELPCTGGPYLAIINLLSYNFDLSALLMLMYYNFIFVLPLLIILFAVYTGVAKIGDVKKWKQSNKAFMRLGIGLLLVFLGWFLIMVSGGGLTLG